MKERLNIAKISPEALEALRNGQTAVASEIIGLQLERFDQRQVEPQQVVPQERKPENQKKHITQSGKR
jgi:hypothetical protein